MSEGPIFHYRVGRKLGRTIYRQLGDQPSDDDVFCGLMETQEQAALVVYCLNVYFANRAVTHENAGVMQRALQRYHRMQRGSD